MAGDVTRWIDPAGGSYDLITFEGAEGRHMPPVEMVSHDVPEQPGARLDRVKVRPREYVQPLVLEGDTAAEHRQSLRTWMRRFDPTRGDGQIEVVAVDGSVRRLTCRYASGLSLIESHANGSAILHQAAAVFLANDPYWYDAADIVADYETGDAGSFFPILPIVLSGSEVFATVTVDNDGDVEAWPVWTITGPGSDPVLRNLSTGKTIDLTGVTLTAGQTLTIDTRPGHKTVVDETGANRFGDLVVGSALWPLRTGSNQVSIEMTGATADSAVRLAYRRGWLSV